MKRVVFASGGSGGHLAPAIALAQQVSEFATLRLWIATTEKKVDQRMRESYSSFDFVGWQGRAYNGSLKSLLLFLLYLGKSLPMVAWFLNRERIDLVVTTGGFGSVPVILAALASGIPVYAHESNSVPGKVTRLFAGLFSLLWYTRLLVGDTQRSQSSRIAGFPLRNDLTRPEREKARRKLGLDPNRDVVTVFGGSQGSKRLTEFAEEIAPALVADGVQLLCVTGPANYMPSGKPPAGVQYKSFIEDMGALYSATNLLISRSGAGSIAEIARCQCPSVLVPLPTSADQHQLKNARAFAENGAALLCEQDRLGDLAGELTEMVKNTQELERMIQAQKVWDRGNDVSAMVAEIVSETGGQRI